jgi:hypothetical protein
MKEEITTIAIIILGQFRNCKVGDRVTLESHTATVSLQVQASHRTFLGEAINWLTEQQAIILIKHPQPMIEITQAGLDLLHRLEQTR